MTDEVFLEELLGAVTVSGYEEEGQAVIRKYMEPLADEVRTCLLYTSPSPRDCS